MVNLRLQLTLQDCKGSPNFINHVLHNPRAKIPTQSMQLGTQAQWGWHAMPNPGGYRFEDALTSYETAHGSVVYPDKHELGPRNPTATPYPGE